MSKFTPGPWHLVNTGDIFTRLGGVNAKGESTEQNDGWHVAECFTGNWHTCTDGVSRELSLDEVRANARLIAAAPDLLEALESLVNSHAPGANFQAVNNARKVIAKARGEHG